MPNINTMLMEGGTEGVASGLAFDNGVGLGKKPKLWGPSTTPALEDRYKHLYYAENQADLDGSGDGLPLGPGYIDPETDELHLGKMSPGPEGEEEDDTGAPTEEDVMRASLAAQRKALRKGQLQGRLSTIMHSKFNKTNQLG